VDLGNRDSAQWVVLTALGGDYADYDIQEIKKFWDKLEHDYKLLGVAFLEGFVQGAIEVYRDEK
jgi:hypothetical protein